MNSESNIPPTPSEVTRLLQRYSAGDKSAGDELAPLLLTELRRLAASYLRRERPFHTWQPTDLVNEAYAKLIKEPTPNFNNRSHFFAIAAMTMRCLLTDHIRRKRSRINGGDYRFVPLLDGYGIPEEKCDLIADLDEALKELEAIDPVLAKVVELKFFGGCSHDEIATILEMSPKTVGRKWTAARAWLIGRFPPKRE